VEEGTKLRLPFTRIRGKKVEADFEGGVVTSDSGMLLLRETNRKIGVIERMSSAIRDERHPSYIEHSLEELLGQRVYQLACGYEDANDCDDLRSDPAVKAACGRLPITGDDLASQPTISRFENEAGPRDLYRMAIALGELFVDSYDKPPKKIILDLDDTDDVVHGSQQFGLFNAFVDDYCYMPLHIYEGLSGKLITTILRPGKRPKGEEIVVILNRVLGFLREAWPKTHIIVRGDSHFSTPEVHDLCEDVPGVDYILGQAVNSKLKELGEPLMKEVIAKAEKTGKTDKPIRAYSEFEYKAGSWRHFRRIIYKAEVTQGKANPRFVVTSLRKRSPKHLYRKAYSARGRMEGFIKEHKNHLKSDRTSCSSFEANQFRLFLHSAAYVLLHALRARALKGTQLATATFQTIQLRVLKIAARVVERATKIEFHLPSSCPGKNLLQTIVLNFDTA
jgi:hypothetical protein